MQKEPFEGPSTSSPGGLRTWRSEWARSTGAGEMRAGAKSTCPWRFSIATGKRRSAGARAGLERFAESALVSDFADKSRERCAIALAPVPFATLAVMTPVPALARLPEEWAEALRPLGGRPF